MQRAGFAVTCVERSAPPRSRTSCTRSGIPPSSSWAHGVLRKPRLPPPSSPPDLLSWPASSRSLKPKPAVGYERGLGVLKTRNLNPEQDSDYGLEDMTWLDPAASIAHPFNWALIAACNMRSQARPPPPSPLPSALLCLGLLKTASAPRCLPRNRCQVCLARNRCLCPVTTNSGHRPPSPKMSCK